MSDDQLRRRVSKACDACRTKKIKCDGDEPCFNCAKSSCSCTYSHVAKKRLKPPTRVSNRKILADLSQRLSKLENILSQIRDEACTTNNHAEKPATSGSAFQPQSFQVDADMYESDESSSTGSDGLEDLMMQQGSRYRPHSGRKQTIELPRSKVEPDETSEATPDTIGESPAIHVMDYEEKNAHPTAKATYVGAYSAFSMFTRKGVEWVHNKLLGGPDILGTILQARAAICSKNFAVFNAHFDKTGLIDTYDFPEPQACEVLFQNFITHAVPVSPVEIAYEIPSIRQKFETSPRTLNSSELFLVDTILLIGSTIQCQICHIQNVDNTKWTMIQTQMMLKTLRMYQQTSLAYSGDALVYIKGVMLLCWQIENSSVPQLAYLLLSTAVRLAQEMSLHLREAYDKISDAAEKLKRHTLWINLYRFDIYLSTRTGKPSSIHDGDTNSLQDWDFYQYIEAQEQSVAPGLKDNTSAKESKQFLPALRPALAAFCSESREGLNFALEFYELHLARHSRNCYRHLLSCKALAENDYNCRSMLAQKLNLELDEWVAMLPAFMRPSGQVENLKSLDSLLNSMPERSKTNSPWSFIEASPASVKLKILIMHMEYYLNLLYTNCVLSRIPWQTESDGPPPGSKGLENDEKCTFAARMMVKVAGLVVSSTNPNISLCGNTLYAFLSGFLNLFYRCVEAPKSGKEDLQLLYDTTMLLVETAKRQRNGYSLKWTVIAFVALSLMKLGSTTYRTETNDYSLPIKDEVIKSELKALQGVLATQPQETLVHLRKIDEMRNNLRPPSRAPDALKDISTTSPSQRIDNWLGDQSVALGYKNFEQNVPDGNLTPSFAPPLADLPSFPFQGNIAEEVPLDLPDTDFLDQFFRMDDPSLDKTSIFRF
ncbi:LAFA_0F16732g1_1 [Lachancea sp. 'fantastica']|nr:LAFA_0F16732g1_1 [Lachancea sp. 'fantastica']